MGRMTPRDPKRGVKEPIDATSGVAGWLSGVAGCLAWLAAWRGWLPGVAVASLPGVAVAGCLAWLWLACAAGRRAYLTCR
jgi:hypothetical protein